MNQIDYENYMEWLSCFEPVKKNVQIRRGVFETNSSSVHSICIATESNRSPLKTIYINAGDFGWEHDFLYSPSEKMSYLVTALYDSNAYDVATTDEMFGKLLTWLKEEDIGYEVNIKKELARYRSGLYYSINGYVDHAEGCGAFLDYVFASKENMLNYLFSPDSFIITGNDNEEDEIPEIDVEYPHEEFWKGN